MAGKKLGKCKNCKGDNIRLINKDDLCYTRCLKKKRNTSQDENKEMEHRCNKCREFILHWGMQCGACRTWFHLETCCNVTDKMFDSYQEMKNADGLWWFCQKCDMKIVDFVKKDVNNQHAKNDNADKNSIDCINLGEDEMNVNNLDLSDTEVKYEILRDLSVVNSQSNSEERASGTDHNGLNAQHSDKIRNAENITNDVFLQHEGLQSQAANTKVNRNRNLEIGKPDYTKIYPKSDQSHEESSNENIDEVSCQSKDKIDIDDDSDSEEELNMRKKRDINVVKESSSEDSNSLPDVSIPKIAKRNHDQVRTNSEDGFTDNGNKKRKRMLKRRKKSSENIVTKSQTEKDDINEISDSEEEEDTNKTPNRYSTPTNTRPVKNLEKRKRQRIICETSESSGSDNAQESANEDNLSKDESFSSDDEDYCSENTTEVENEETDESYKSCDDSVRASLNEVLMGVGRSGYDVASISYQGKGYEHTPKKKKTKTLTLEQRIKKRLYPSALLERLRKHSVEQKSIKKILEEWKFHGYQYVDDDTDDINDSIDGEHYVHEEDTNQCSCKKRDLKHLFFIKNIKHKDNPVLIVGSECISWFYDTNSSNLYKIFVDVFTKKHQYTFNDIVEDPDNDDDECKVRYEFKTSARELCVLKSYQKAMLKTFRSIPFTVGRKHAFIYASPWNNESLQLKKKQDYFLRFFSKVENEKLIIYVKSKHVQKCNQNHKNDLAIVRQLIYN